MSVDFLKMMTDAGLPTTEELAKQQWEDELAKQSIAVNNGSPFSPFWRTIKSLITLPVISLFTFIAKELMPDQFIMTASRETLIDKHGPSRNVFVFDAIKAKGTVTFNRVDTTGIVTIDVGTVISSNVIAGKTYQLITLQTAVFYAGDNAAYASVEAIEAGQGFNLPDDSYHNFVDPIEGVTVSNANDWLITPGADEEPTESYRNRIRNVFGTAAKWHINAVYKQIISDFGVPIDNIEIINGAPRGPGTANAYVYLNVGAVPAGLLATINQHITDDGHHGHGDDFIVYDIPVQNIDITATYWLHANSNDISNDIDTFIKAAFRQNKGYSPTRPRPNAIFSISLLKTELHNQFPELKSIIFDAGDITCELWLPNLNNLSLVAGG